MIVGLCERFKCLPSQLYQEDAEFLRMVAIVDMGAKREEPGYEEESE
ncbi:hypothetical protein [Streptomyces sp. NPDC007984]